MLFGEGVVDANIHIYSISDIKEQDNDRDWVATLIPFDLMFGPS